MSTHFNTALSRWLAIIPFLTGILCAQTTLVLSSATTTTENASIELSLDSSSGVAPAAIQWTFRYPSSSIRSIDIVNGPALASADKAIVCAGDAGLLTCMAVGLNAELIPDGVVATINVVLEPVESTATIDIVDALAVSSAGYPIEIAATSGAATWQAASAASPPLRRVRDLLRRTVPGRR